MPGAPLLHGYPTSTSPAGEGGAARIASSSRNQLVTAGPSPITFAIWLLVFGVVLPAIIMGGLRFGKFQFVFRTR